MDAAEADGDVKLYKASGELLAELQAKLPLLVSSRSGRVRKWVFTAKTYELMKLLDAFQEWPQLLDPILSKLVQTLVDAFLSCCMEARHIYVKLRKDCPPQVEPLSRSICRILYVLCKVRGYKVIVRLLNNEPKYIEPILVSFRVWAGQSEANSGWMVWEERYIMLLWLSHLMLAPFELSTISAVAVDTVSIPSSMGLRQIPKVAENLLSLALDHLSVSSKDREAASILAVRLALRGDMQRCGMHVALARWCVEQLKQGNEIESSQYWHIGILTLLFSLIRSASDSEAAPFVLPAFKVSHFLSTSPESKCSFVRDAAPSRKLLVKVMRSTLEHVISLATKGMLEDPASLELMLEESIDVLLQWLSDSDTPVRQAVSKALSMIVSKLNADLSAEVIEAVLGCLNENILLEDLQNGTLLPASTVLDSDAHLYRKNLNAVDPLKWHGAMLTLGHLLFRRSPPVYQLPVIVQSLLIGLQFEQRSNVGTSIGVGVRDAACFGIWSLARRYSTKELLEVSVSTVSLFRAVVIPSYNSSVLQNIATELVVASCYDPAGNLRRGSSAALQELIGRHPDAILQGIPIVQAVDYHAVARRSRAMIEVSLQAAHLGSVYHNMLLASLLDWRGVRATDATSRIQAATAVGKLYHISTPETRQQFGEELMSQLSDLRSSNVGTTAAARQGLLTAAAAIVLDIYQSEENAIDVLKCFRPLLEDFPAFTGTVDGRVTADLVNVLEAISKVIRARACLASLVNSPGWIIWDPAIENILNRCTVASDDENLTQAAAEANQTVFKGLSVDDQAKLLSSWLDETQNKSEYSCKGRIRSIGMLYSVTLDGPIDFEPSQLIIRYLTSMVSGKLPIETKVNAMESIAMVLKCKSVFNDQQIQQLFSTVGIGLSDYTIDQRGDIGSLLRLSSINTANHIIVRFGSINYTHQLISSVVRLAAERLTKVRFEAWKCLENYWRQYIRQPTILHFFHHQADVSSAHYYEHLVQLIQIPELHEQLLVGLISSQGGGTDDISRSCSEGLVSFLIKQSAINSKHSIITITRFSIEYLGTLFRKDDREVVPALDFLSFIVEQFITVVTDFMTSRAQVVFETIDKFQTSTATIQRTEALVRLLLALTGVDGLRLRGIDYLTRKLLHKWPRIRGLAADAIFLCAPVDLLIDIDWNAPPAQNKAQVVELRKMLGVAGLTTKRTAIAAN